MLTIKENRILKLFVLLLVIVFLAVGCGGATQPDLIPGGNNPEAAPPAPPPQLPTFVQFPESIAEVSITKIQSGSVAAKVGLIMGLATSENLRGSALSVLLIYEFTDQLLSALNQLKMPVSFDRYFEGVIILPGFPPFDVTVDFADFDSRGCSGHTAGLPVCFRIWIDGVRAFFGQFDAYATDINAGAGELIGESPFGLTQQEGIPFFFNEISLSYDLVDAQSKRIDFSATIPNNSALDDDYFRFLIEQEPFEDTLLKTLREVSTNNPEISGYDKYQTIDRWADDRDFLSSSRVESLEGFENILFEALCESIATAIILDREICIENGVDVGDVEFIEFLEITDFDFPPDFPEDEPNI